MDSKGDVRRFFWLVFRKPLARILLLFEAFASGFPRPDGGLETCFLWIPKEFFWPVFRKPLARILLLFEAFASGFPRPDLFFMDSKGDVRQFFWLVFRKPLARILLLFEAFASGFPRPDGGLETCFLWIPKVTFGSFSGLCFASLWHESCCCLRLSQAVFQGQTEG